MVKRELAVRYVGTIGGPLWVILQPLATVFVFWFVFSVGLKTQGPAGTSFIAYFLPAYLAWLLFAEAMSSSVNSIVGNSHLVKKTLFPTEILPVVHLAVSSLTHVVLLIVVCFVLIVQGVGLHLTLFQVIYYYSALVFLVLGISWALSALQAFHRDIGQIMGVVLNLWFWITPIIWATEVLPADYLWVVKYNPIYYIVEGYRRSLLYGIPLWQDLGAALRFWVIVIPILILGANIFGRLKPEFADVL